MLTDQDIQKLENVIDKKLDQKLGLFATKKDVENIIDQKIGSLEEKFDQKLDPICSNLTILKQDVKRLEGKVDDLTESLQGMLIAVDKLVGAITDLRMEYVGIVNELKRHEDWIKQIAVKSGVVLQ